MLSTAIVIFREALEIAMILGIVLASTRGLPRRTAYIIAGFIAGACGAALVAFFAQSISNALEGVGQELFNATILFAAALMIGWTVLWMRKHSRHMSLHLKQIGHDVAAGTLPLYSLSIIIGLAILREGSEIVLFIYGMFLSGQKAASIAGGTAIGLTLGLIAGVMLYYGLLKIPARHALKITSWLLMLLVAGLASQGAGFLSAAGYFSDFSTPLWDTSWLLSEETITGKTLHSLIGYTAQPTPVQLMFYLGTLLSILSVIMVENRREAKKLLACAALFIACTIAMKTPPALALDEIYSPNVEEGEVSVEYNGSRTFDQHSDKNNAQEHQLALEYGVNSRWEIELSGGFAKDPDNALKMEDVELENRFQFTEAGEYWLDSGLLASYHVSTQSHEPDSAEVKLLLQKDTGNFTHIANIGFEQTLGKNSGGTGGPDYAFLWSSRYRYEEYFEPGFEIQSDLGQGPLLGKFNDQEHYIGPAAYGRIFGNLKYQAAYLFGISTSSAQSAARLLLEYEMHF